MGIASYSVGAYGRNRGSGAGQLISSVVVTSGAHSTTTTASSLSDAGGAITMAQGQVLRIHPDVAMRVRFGGVAATASTGHYLPGGILCEIECNEPGTVSIVDVA